MVYEVHGEDSSPESTVLADGFQTEQAAKDWIKGYVSDGNWGGWSCITIVEDGEYCDHFVPDQEHWLN